VEELPEEVSQTLQSWLRLVREQKERETDRRSRGD